MSVRSSEVWRLDGTLPGRYLLGQCRAAQLRSVCGGMGDGQDECK